MASRVGARGPAFVSIQTVFLAWAIFGCLALARTEGLAAEDEAGAALATRPSFVSPAGRRVLSEPARRENLGFCFFPCFGLLPDCCFGLCTNLKTDKLNCGTCGKICPLITGLTQPFCCNGNCTNVLIDPKNCGLCGKSCGTGGKCILGFCNYNGKPIFP